MSVEPLKFSTYFELKFLDHKHAIRLQATGRRRSSRTTTTLFYTKEEYGTAKKEFQRFLDEPNITKKLNHLATAINIGSESDYLTELVFLLNILFYYPWEAKR